jgi:acetylornithine deacetylase/succinyl-diaminopimelate desuccinylase-like protein
LSTTGTVGVVHERIIELTTALVAIPTHEREGDAQQLIASWLQPIGFACTIDEVAPGRPNLVAQRGEGGPFLCSHIDTHPPHAHPDPLSCRRQGDLLVGRGVLDAKGQIAAAVAGVEAEPGAGALLAVTCDEERTGLGSAQLSLPGGPWSTDGGVVLEPTDFAICTAQAGHIDVHVEVSGSAGHAYGPEEGGSPIHAVLAAVDELETCNFLKASHALLGRPRRNIGRISGGEHPWRKPARAGVDLTLGVVPGTDLAGAEADVRARLDDVARRWGARGTSFLYEIVDRSEPIELSPDSVPVAAKLADAMGIALEPGGMPSWTDAGNLLTRHAQPCVVFGAGNLSSAHSDHEWVRLDDLVKLSNVLRRLLRNAGTAP